jgi:hypothetical protein
MKIYGESYGKVESNAAIDIHMMTNWIPETVSFDDVNNKENLWTRLLQNFRDQNIILCIETNQNQEGEKDVYSVLDLIEVDDMCLLQCKSPFKND